MTVPIIEKTNDYSIFKSVNFNRDKKRKHIESVKKMLIKDNLLHLHPILVNEKMEVIDGQHRLEAARELNVPVFFIKSDVSYEHILNSNLLQKKASLADVIKFYALKDRLRDYIELQKNVNALNISPKAMLSFMFGSTSPGLVALIKSGKFRMPPNASKLEGLIFSYQLFLDYCREKRITPIAMFISFHFTVAFRNLLLLDSFSEKLFYQKLDNRWFDLKPQINSKEWTRVLVDIYNWKNRSPLEYNGA